MVRASGSDAAVGRTSERPEEMPMADSALETYPGGIAPVARPVVIALDGAIRAVLEATRSATRTGRGSTSGD
jgi:hypothetical protein